MRLFSRSPQTKCVGLTILGIVIGIGSVIAMVAIGQGAQGSIQSSHQRIGSNLHPRHARRAQSPATGSAGRGSAQTLTADDAAALDERVNVAAVAPEVPAANRSPPRAPIPTPRSSEPCRPIRRAQCLRSPKAHSSPTATESQPAPRSPFSGRHRSERPFRRHGTEPVGQTISIKGLQFTVIGVTVAKGRLRFTNNQDDVIYVPISAAQLFRSGNQIRQSIGVAAASQAAMTQVQNEITTLLFNRHKSPIRP